MFIPSSSSSEPGSLCKVQQLAHLHVPGIILGVGYPQSRFLLGRLCLGFVHVCDTADLILVFFGLKQSTTNLNSIGLWEHGMWGSLPEAAMP